MKWNYSIAAALIGIICGVGQINAAVVSRIAAIVNDEVITTSQIERKLAEHKDKIKNLSGAEMSGARRQVLNSLIEETLVRQRIKELKIEIGDTELDAAIADVRNSNQLSQHQLEAALAQQGMTFEMYRENMRIELLRYRLLNQDVRRKIMVPNQEVLDYFRNHIDEFRQQPFLRLAYLNFATNAAPGKDKIKARALEIQSRLRAGANLDAVLNEIAGENYIDGGSLGKINVDDLSPVYAQAVNSLKEKEVSELLESPDTLRLLYVEEKSPGEVRNFDEVRDNIEKKLTDQRMEERFKAWAEDLKREARIEILL